jgi:hypothetical protein
MSSSPGLNSFVRLFIGEPHEQIEALYMPGPLGALRPDEHSFTEGSFAGLTEAEARSRFHSHDVACFES